MVAGFFLVNKASRPPPVLVRVHSVFKVNAFLMGGRDGISARQNVAPDWLVSPSE